MTSQPGKQAIAMHILPNISRRQGNQTMKFGQLIVYNMKNIFLENLTKRENLIKKTVPRHFFKNSQLSISLDQ